MSQNCKGLKILDVVPSVAANGTATASARLTAIADKRKYTKEFTKSEVSCSTALAF